MVTIIIRTKLVKPTSEHIRGRVLLMEGVQVKIDMQMLQKPGRGDRGETLQNVFLFKTNRLHLFYANFYSTMYDS